MARRSKQLDADIAAALAHGAPHPEATVSDWKKHIVAIKARFHKATSEQEKAIIQEEYKAAQLGQRAAEKATAMKPSFVTGTNRFALKSLAVKYGGPEFPNRLEATDVPHIKRTVAAGLAEVVGGKIRLTPAGREVVADEIIQDIEHENKWTPRQLMIVPGLSESQHAAVVAQAVAKHDAKVQRLENTLAAMRR